METMERKKSENERKKSRWAEKKRERREDAIMQLKDDGNKKTKRANRLCSCTNMSSHFSV